MADFFVVEKFEYLKCRSWLKMGASWNMHLLFKPLFFQRGMWTKEGMRIQFGGMWGRSLPAWGCYPLNLLTACRTVPTSGIPSLKINQWIHQIPHPIPLPWWYTFDKLLFRDSLHSHEKELERTSQNIKELIKEVKNLVGAAKNLSRAQRSLSDHLVNFKFDCIGSNQVNLLPPDNTWNFYCWRLFLRLTMNWWLRGA